MLEISVNYFALVGAVVVNTILGMLWYGPLFGKQWMALMGFTPESMKASKDKAKQSMIIAVVAAFVMAYVLVHFAWVWGAEGVQGAFELSFWIWLGFIAPVMLGSVLWEGKPVKLYVLNIAYQFTSIFLMALVVVFWK